MEPSMMQAIKDITENAYQEFGYLDTVLIIPNSKINILLLDMSSVESKDKSAEIIQMHRNLYPIVFLVCEAWVATVKETEVKRDVLGNPVCSHSPSSDPDRKEAVFIIEYQGAEINSEIAMIDRDDKNNVKLGDWESMSSSGSEIIGGRLVQNPSLN